MKERYKPAEVLPMLLLKLPDGSGCPEEMSKPILFTSSHPVFTDMG